MEPIGSDAVLKQAGPNREVFHVVWPVALEIRLLTI